MERQKVRTRSLIENHMVVQRVRTRFLLLKNKQTNKQTTQQTNKRIRQKLKTWFLLLKVKSQGKEKGKNSILQ